MKELTAKEVRKIQIRGNKFQLEKEYADYISSAYSEIEKRYKELDRFISLDINYKKQELKERLKEFFINKGFNVIVNRNSLIIEW